MFYSLNKGFNPSRKYQNMNILLPSFERLDPHSIQSIGNSLLIQRRFYSWIATGSVRDPDPHVFGPPGSGSISQRYGPGSFPFLINVLSGLK
jgi:hypothetical protein